MAIEPKKILIWILIIMLIFPIYRSDRIQASNEGTNVSGLINEDTTWSKEGSPYYLTGIITIPSNVTLTIEPGVTIIGKYGTWIDVKGKIMAIGGKEEGERIQFDSAYVNGWSLPETYVHIENSNISRLTGGFLVTGKNIFLKNNIFSNGSILISNPNTMEPVITDNVFQNKATMSLYLGLKDIIIRNNTFINAESDVFPADIDIHCSQECSSPNVQLLNNNFFGINHAYIKLQSDKQFTINGANNYWGTTEKTKINQFIVDANDNINFRAILNTEPIANKPHNHGHPLGALTPPLVYSVGDNHLKVTGLTDADSTIHVWNHSKIIGSGSSNPDGTFSVNISKQTAVTELRIQVIDSYNRSSIPTVISVMDTTPPDAPVVNHVTDKMDFVTGHAEPNTKILVSSNQQILGIGTSNEEGFFQIYTGTLSANTILQIQAEDLAGHKSPIVIATVTDVTPPPNAIVNMEITEETREVTGFAEPGSTVVVLSNSKEIVRTTVNFKGEFSSYIGYQKAGSIIEIYVEDASKNKSNSITFKVKDVTPPYLIVLKQGDSHKQLSGMSEVGAVISIFKNEFLLGKGVVEFDYGFSVPIPSQPVGTKLVIVSEDKAGNKTKVEIVVEDLTPPTKPVVETINDQSTLVIGKTEAFATVQAFIDSKKIATVEANDSGIFTFPIHAQVAGTVIQIISTDKAGNKSNPISVKVKDVTPPPVPIVNTITNKMAYISGRTEISATVIAKIATKTYTVKADADGSYKLVIPIQNSGTKVTVTAKDRAGNVSKEKNVQITRVAPNVPIVSTVNNKMAYVSGKTEKAAIVSVKIGKKSYSGKADQYGSFKVSIPVQNANSILSVTAKDQDGKISAAKKVTVTKVATNIPIVNPVRYYSTAITGKTEKYATVTAKIGTKIYSAKANAYGNYKINIPKQRKGTLIYMNAVDSSKIKSATQTVKVY